MCVIAHDECKSCLRNNVLMYCVNKVREKKRKKVVVQTYIIDILIPMTEILSVFITWLAVLADLM